jgi:phosphoribosylanthranilate isomerase
VLDVKVCGLTDAAAVGAAAEGGARFLGFVFYPPSPRALAPAEAARLVALAPAGCRTVGVLVDPDDAQLEALLRAVPLDALQLHGAQTPERVAAIKAASGRLVIKALSVAGPEDLAAVAAYAEVADMLLFDARPPPDPDALPGGNGQSFDWRLLAGLGVARPWLLAGGLSAANLESAVRLSGARAVDVSSGVEDRPGHKSPGKIGKFLTVAAALGAPA